ncbi:SRPBCC family protein [Methyloglobulus sp.]|uniref:SRPBCC family protein n=1 Tax=Methyloglobulus sp. TaxID=2518622 RepID=UPI0039899004
MLNIILFLIIIGIIVVFVLANRQPDDFRITRTGTISAPASAIFPHVNKLQNWDAWSPWAKLDPNAKNSFEGSAEGVGAKMSWVGNNKVGVGSMTITESHPDDFIQFKLEFQKPMQATNIAEFTFTPEGNQTTVTWSMTGTNNFMAKVMGLIMNCDKMVGGQFEKGLAALKTVVEADR